MNVCACTRGCNNICVIICRVFTVARRAALIPPHKIVRHVPFGVVLGVDGKKLKSRSGDTVKLKDLLSEAIGHAERAVSVKNSEKSIQFSAGIPAGNENSSKELAEKIGIAAVKYADLSMNRESNYKFNPEKMVSLTGNTAPYMLYALVRIR